MSCDSVLRIGPTTHDNASAAFLRAALLAHFGETSTSNEPQQEKDVLNVTNRYFEARVLLRELGSDDKNNDQPAKTYKEDGVILVFDALRSNPDLPIASSSSSSFDSLTAVHEQAERLGQCGDLLRLCVGVSMGSMSASELRGKQHEEEYSRRVLWCLDRGYEYVEADLSAEGQKKGHDQRDKEGFARIVEAITGTMWTSAKMTGASPKTLLKQSYEKESQSDAVATNKDDDSNPYVPPDDSMLPTQTEDSSDTPLDPKLAQPGDASKAFAGLVSEEDADAWKDNQHEPAGAEDKENGDPEELERRRREQEQESLFEDLERVMGEAKRIREASQSGTLSDDERRKRAGDAAMLMMELMDKLDFDDDSDDAHDSSDEEEINE